MPRTGPAHGSVRPWRLLIPAIALAFLSPTGIRSTPVFAAPGASSDLDALVQSAIDGVPAEKASEVVAWILEAHEGTTGYHAISPASLFQSGQPNQDLVLDTASGSLRVDDFFDQCAYAPVHLPQGSTVVAFLMWVRDNNPADDSTATLRRFRIDGATGVQELAAVTSSGSGAGSRIFSDFTIANGVVDNATFWYFVYVCLPSFSDSDGPTELRGLYLSYSF